MDKFVELIERDGTQLMIHIDTITLVRKDGEHSIMELRDGTEYFLLDSFDALKMILRGKEPNYFL